MSRADKAVGAPWRTGCWVVVAAALPAGSAAALVTLRGTVSNTDSALLIIGAVLLTATSGRRSAAALAALSAAVSFDYFHTLPYQSLTIANRNDAVATLVLGLLALAAGQIAAHAYDNHIELVLVVGAAVLSQAVPQPARFLVDHQGLDVSLAVLVFTTALAIPPRTFRGLAVHAGRLVAAVISTALALPALAWAASRLVHGLALRRGVLTVGLAPAEIASVATTSLAGADTAIAAGMLVASTLLTVAAAGIGLRLLGGGGTIHLVPLLTNLALVVGAPMAAGIAIRAGLTLSDRQEAAAERLSVAVVTLLVWLVASQVRLSSNYLTVAAALVLFLAGSAILGTALGFRAPAPVATALLLTTSMRDFAIAAGIAVAAFGAASAAPLGLYGVMAIGWGMAIATLRPTRPAMDSARPRPVPSSMAAGPPSPTPASGPLVAPRSQPAPFEASVSSFVSTTTAEVDVSTIISLLGPGDRSVIGFVARGAVDALTALSHSGPAGPPPVTLGVIRHSPSGVSLGVVERADELRLRALEEALAWADDKPSAAWGAVALWLSDGSSSGHSTAVTGADTTVLSVSAVRREPRIIQTTDGGTVAARSTVTLTLASQAATIDPTSLLLDIVNAIQTRDWSTEF